MQLAYAILADAAEISANGKISMLGGEVTEITAPVFPAFPIHLAFIVKLLLQPEDSQKEHLLQIKVASSAPSLQPDVEMPFMPQDTGERPLKFLIVIQSPITVFPQPGVYEFRFLVDGMDLGSTVVRLKEASTSQP